MKPYFPAIVAFILAITLPVNASTQQPCGHTDEVMQGLRKYNETVWATGINRSGDTVKMWGNADTGTWTFTMEQYGVMCLMTAGVDFKPIVQGREL